MVSARQSLDALINLFIPEIKNAFLASMQDIVDSVILQQVIDAIKSGDVEQAFKVLGFSPAALRPLIAAIEKAYETGGIMKGQTFPKYLNTTSGKAVFRFDVRNSRAEAWLRDKSSNMIVQITDETRKNVQTVLRQGMVDGRNPRNVALDIIGRVDPGRNVRTGGIIGLTTHQISWVDNTRADLETLNERYFTRVLRDKRFDRTVAAAIRDGKPLPREVIDRLVSRYRDNALQYRGENIARTEAMQSLNASEHEATRQVVDMGAVSKNAVEREWDSAGDTRVRYTHSKLDGQRVGLDEPFTSPSGAQMMHPGDRSLGAPVEEIAGCRCRVRSIIDWLDGVE